MVGFAPRRSSVGVLAVCGLSLALVGHYATPSQKDLGFVGSSANVATQRPLKVSCQGVDKKMKDRITSVQKTGKLTDAMRLVAAAKVRRAQDGVAKSRPFSDELQSMIKGIVKKLKGSGLEQELPMLKVPEKVTNVGLVLVTSNRGLCGAYNTFVMKRALKRTLELNAQGIVPKLICIGKKSLIQLRTRWEVAGAKYNNTGIWFGMPDSITSATASEISDSIRNIFLSGDVDKVEIIYAKFFSLVKNEPTVRSMLPLTPTGIEDPEDETFRVTTEYGKLKVEREKVKAPKAREIENDVIFDQEPAVILNSMLPLYLNSQLVSILYDAQASELSSRMTAMKAATDNAGELVKALTSVFNKKRQAGITAEICEISAGASCIDTEMSPLGPDLGLEDNEDSVLPDLLQELEFGSLPEFPPVISDALLASEATEPEMTFENMYGEQMD
mmetsp:Transcript_41056/g.105956  ORF Transcript_41056/g.105956 Transcript_41056/m.105956 type:complete len:444 (+) Transcript_41056:106-1437(+)